MTTTAHAPEITDHLELENTIAEMHDELYRMTDFAELGEYNAAHESHSKCAGYMSAIKDYLNKLPQQEE